MKKVMLKTFTVVLIGVSVTGCEATSGTYNETSIEQTVNQENWTKQPLENAKYLRAGMTESEVIQIMGEPITREFQGRRSALQWCHTGTIGTGMPYDRFLMAAFTDERLTEIKNFSNKDEFEIMYAQVDKNGGIDCASLIQNVHWLKPADQIIEHRDRNMNFYR